MTPETIVDTLSMPTAASRETALDAAGELLATRGLVGLTMAAVAQRAGISCETLHEWWPSEEELALDALGYEWHELARHVSSDRCHGRLGAVAPPARPIVGPHPDRLRRRTQ
jgi:AcrR family transcriptional regulator